MNKKNTGGGIGLGLVWLIRSGLNNEPSVAYKRGPERVLGKYFNIMSVLIGLL